MICRAEEPNRLLAPAAGVLHQPYLDRSSIPDACPVTVAHRQRATDVRRMCATGIARLRNSDLVLPVLLVTAASVGLVLTYATALSHQGFSVSAIALLVVLLAATLSSIAGFAFSAICGVMLLQVMHDPVQVVEIMMICSIAIQSLTVTLLWRDIDWKRLGTFLIGGPIGLPLGVGLLLHLDPHIVRHVIGAVLTAYAGWVLLKRPMALRRTSKAADIGMGFLGGITGGLAGFPGATVAAWCGLTESDKRRQRATYQPFILIMQVLALALIQAINPSGMQTAVVSLTDLEFIPPALLGTVLGLTLFTRLSDRHFTVVVNMLLMVSGLGLLL